MAAGHWPAREQEHCQECKAPAGAQVPLALTSSPHGEMLCREILIDMLS